MNDTWYDMGFDADMSWIYDWKGKEKKIGISELKKKIVIDNYFKKECDVNTSIKEAFTKGFELGLEKASIPQPQTGYWIYTPKRRLIDETDEGGVYTTDYRCTCSECGGDFGFRQMSDSYCKYCGAKMVKQQESENDNGRKDNDI